MLVKRKFSPASVLCDLSGVALPWRLFRFIAYHSLFYRRRYSPFNHSRFVKTSAGCASAIRTGTVCAALLDVSYVCDKDIQLSIW